MPDHPAAPHLDDLPGHYIRRLQQMAVAIFLEETEAHGITPVQYAAMQAVHDRPELDQRSLSRSIGFDTSTIGGGIFRLGKGGLIERQTSAEDRRRGVPPPDRRGRELLQRSHPAQAAG